ncbi:hypothetical protein VTJ04DRAFT_2697 [Mycothermus thermophilus]|uniref:uncharacterized protein n=1 Tax=Humicola insolens TaxID=85995 RepID=UPI0037445BFD
MAAVAQNQALQAGKSDTASSGQLSITTANHDAAISALSPTTATSPAAVSTPGSSCSAAPPIAIRPSAVPAARGGMPSAPLTGSLSMTTKEWVIPPRPKPGRKPATDTPPTKRKAQNRAAQRAFRERRAARVGELEEQLEEEKENHERAVRELQERINHLELETQTLQSRCQMLEALLEKERQSRAATMTSWDATRNEARSGSLTDLPMNGQINLPPPVRSMQPTPLRSIAASTLPLAEPRPLSQPFSIANIVSPPDTSTSVSLGCGTCQSTGSCPCAEEVLRSVELTVGCGKCTLGSRCECLEEALQPTTASGDLKRPLPAGTPPPTSPEEKRQRSDAGVAMETDFTALFSSQTQRTTATTQSLFTPPSDAHLQPLTSIEPRDPCGFCKDGSYCVCADAMLSAPLPAPNSSLVSEQTQTHTPPPSENDVVPLPMEVTATGAIKLPRLQGSQRQQKPTNSTTTTAVPSSSSCGPNGPGTCAQCLADPKSGLFCRSLAANFEKNNSINSNGGGCCGGGGPGGCCKSGGSSSDAQQQASSGSTTKLPSLGLSLSCADAYKTLASHRHFDEAADDIGSWLPKLKALPVPRPTGGLGAGHGGSAGSARAPIEVEAASIMSVLKDFDIRFGRGE